MTINYEIRIRGYLDEKWQGWFDGMVVTPQGDGTTILSGPVTDQPDLFSKLRKIRNLGLPLISVNQISGLCNQKNHSNKGEENE